MRITGVEHVGIAVGDLDACVSVFESVLGVRCSGREKVEARKVEIAVFDCGNTKIELVCPTHPDSPVSAFVAKHGNALHHVCLRVEGIDAMLDSLSERGIQLIDRKPRDGAMGKRVAFLSPKSLANILIELSEGR